MKIPSLYEITLPLLQYLQDEIPKTKKEIAIKRGRFGPYVTDGKKNVSLKGYAIEDVTLEEAIKLIAEKK